MKRLISFLVLMALAAAAARAQVTNGDFEAWDSTQGHDVPVDWTGTAFGVGKAQSAYSGSSAVSVWNWYYYSKGYVVAGRGSNAFWYDQGGVAIDYKPLRLHGYYMYVLGSNQGHQDSAIVQVLLKKHNAARQNTYDTVAFGRVLLGPVGTYTPFTVDIGDVAPGVAPDTMVVALISSDKGFCDPASSGNCCYLSVDHLWFETSAGVNVPATRLFNTTVVRPNPVRSGARIEWRSVADTPQRLLLYASNGSLARVMDGITGGGTAFDRGDLPAGAYRFEVRDEAGAMVAAGGLVIR
ncbi:MAG TPA: hypothetical protein VHI13_01525 [Candidatus Kapabacteria bacterium]|nr:hypothetical protein [Candidatus Kapabacteria bacterium]